MIDASLPFRAGTAGAFSLADLLQQNQQLRHGEQAMQQRERSLDQQDRAFELEMQQHTARLDAAQREAAAKGLDDVAAAVQWAAGDPQKWATVQQSYARYFPEIASIPVERAQEVLVMTGKMSDYLKATQERFQAIEPGGSLFGISPTGDVREVVRANPGTAAPMAPVGGDLPRVSTPAEAMRLPPGSQFITPDGRIGTVPGGPASAPGNFR